MVTGCFDVLHFGHIQLFCFAKKRVDVLIVGIDNDRTISLSKGKGRPIFPQEVRLEVLSEQESIDYVFIVDEVFNYGTHKADQINKNLLKKVQPTHVFTYWKSDKYW